MAFGQNQGRRKGGRKGGREEGGKKDEKNKEKEKERKPKSRSLKRTEFCEGPHKFASRFLRSQASNETTALANTLFAGLRFCSRGSH